ncbi:MAG: NAD(P)/FAD-dependent oxidoreductase [bacterium]|nr:NAD(P)/FAD-dependent oxidoreductase [bacterium]
MNTTTQQWDVIILGGGAAGLSAGIFAARRGMKTLIVTKEVGGQTATTYEIENYPGVGRISGPDLIRIMKEQAERFGCEFLYGDIHGVSKDGDIFTIQVGQHSKTSTALIAASGKRPRHLGIADETQWLGNGVYYSSTDILEDQTKNKIVAVIGGGSAALEEALLHAKTATKVYIIHRGGSFRAEDILVRRVEDTPTIECIFHAEVRTIDGDEVISSLSYEQESTVCPLLVDIICVKIGYDSDASFFESFVQLDSQKRIPIDKDSHTLTPGFFAAGDMSNVDFQQIVVSAGDGAKAGLSAYFYIMDKKGIKGTKADWGYIGK